MKKQQSGFTLIELMLAMALFTMLLVVMLGAFTQINATYYKGIASSKAQEAARTISDEVSGDAKSNGKTLPQLFTYGTVGSGPPIISLICTDANSFYLMEGVQAVPGQNIAVKVNGEGCVNKPADYSAAKTRMNTATPPDKYRTLVGGNVSIHGVELNEGVLRVRTLYGDPDAASGNVEYEVVDGKNVPRCKGGVSRGFQFCATAQMTTVLQNRLR